MITPPAAWEVPPPLDAPEEPAFTRSSSVSNSPSQALYEDVENTLEANTLEANTLETLEDPSPVQVQPTPVSYTIAKSAKDSDPQKPESPHWDVQLFNPSSPTDQVTDQTIEAHPESAISESDLEQKLEAALQKFEASQATEAIAEISEENIALDRANESPVDCAEGEPMPPDIGALGIGALGIGVPDIGVPDIGVSDTGALDIGALDTGALDTGALWDDLPPSPDETVTDEHATQFSDEPDSKIAESAPVESGAIAKERTIVQVESFITPFDQIILDHFALTGGETSPFITLQANPNDAEASPNEQPQTVSSGLPFTANAPSPVVYPCDRPKSETLWPPSSYPTFRVDRKSI